ncbi:rhodanese-like domain-containing protein [Epibacterium sp. SM1979]|uniref:Rhodanese-like domain-containing protein n=2 Tax=Tritonibacter litoralis TaxID=2662264 RepID=A0A843YLB2_9RHOB|nr:rhodanese-like domain-containing protein [Tritonibacter litoralis]
MSQRLNRRGLLIGGVVVASALVLARWQYLTPPEHTGGRLSVSEAYDQALNGDITLVDIRTPREWRATGVPQGGHLIDMRREDFTDALQAVVGTDKNAPVALICARGVRSARMTLRLNEAGFTNIIDVPEGMLGSKAGPGWIKTELPVVQWNG